MKKESLKQQAYNIIKNKIISCEYPPNYLLNEEKLKEEIGASRTPIRECVEQAGTGKSGTYLTEEGNHGRLPVYPGNQCNL